jgi:DNA repair protein RecO (recombination protein O)
MRGEVREVKGLVIRTTDIRESDRILTIFTEELGVISALASGARTLKSRKMSSTMQFCYSSFVLYGHGDKYWVREAELIESFYDIRNTIEGLALANYIAEVLSDVTVAEADRDLLRLSLNSLYAIGSGKYPIAQIKAAFEIRAASILGFMPDVLSCHICDGKRGDFFFDIMGGTVECAECRARLSESGAEHPDPHESHILCILTEGAKAALGYCIYSPIERIFSFSISDEDMRLFARATEEYLVNQLGHGFRTLAFYNEVKR